MQLTDQQIDQAVEFRLQEKHRDGEVRNPAGLRKTLRADFERDPREAFAVLDRVAKEAARARHTEVSAQEKTRLERRRQIFNVPHAYGCRCQRTDARACPELGQAFPGGAEVEVGPKGEIFWPFEAQQTIQGNMPAQRVKQLLKREWQNPIQRAIAVGGPEAGIIRAIEDSQGKDAVWDVAEQAIQRVYREMSSYLTPHRSSIEALELKFELFDKNEAELLSLRSKVADFEAVKPEFDKLNLKSKNAQAQRAQFEALKNQDPESLTEAKQVKLDALLKLQLSVKEIERLSEFLEMKLTAPEARRLKRLEAGVWTGKDADNITKFMDLQDADAEKEKARKNNRIVQARIDDIFSHMLHQLEGKVE